MKKSGSSSYKNSLLGSKDNYYKEVGINAALSAFTTSKNKTQSLKFSSPDIRRILSPE